MTADDITKLIRELHEMPSSLNDACRKMELAADALEQLSEALRWARAEKIETE